MQRADNRAPSQCRPITITRKFTKHAEGSVLIEFGDTQVICTASVAENVPRFLRGKNQGWITAEYGMLPRSTHTRIDREAARGKQSGRTLEISRLIGRALRQVVNLNQLGERTIHIDCDVIQADGGTRTASITGGCVALVDAINHLLKHNRLKTNPIKRMVASVSVGVYQDIPVLDLDYIEDSNAQTDMNVVMDDSGRFIEIQGTAEAEPFSQEHLNTMLELAKQGIQELFTAQQNAGERNT